MSERVLCIGAHADDESFGCLGTLLKHKQAGDKISFIWFTQARDTIKGAKKVARYFDARMTYCRYPDQQLESFGLTDLISEIEAKIKTFKPTVVYTNFIGDLNKDHRIVSEATMVACRPYLPDAPKQVWMYRVPGTTELGLRQFAVDRCVYIDGDEKTRLLKLWYPGELKNGRNITKHYEWFEAWPR